MLKPGNIRCMLEIDSTAVGTKFMAKLDKEMTPILAELTTLDPSDREHSSVKELYNWMVASERTGDEFYYVVGPLQEYVIKVMTEQFVQYVNQYALSEDETGGHLGKVAAEALAEICPILEGPWEIAAWVILKESTRVTVDLYGSLSERVTLWLIHVIGDPGLCPNPYLRIELMSLLSHSVDLFVLKDNNLIPKTVESILSACSYLSVEYLQESKPYYDYFHYTRFKTIMGMFGYFCIYGGACNMIDDNFSKRLQNVKSLRLSAHIYDVSHQYAINPSKFEEPLFLKGLTVILEIIVNYIQLDYREFQNEHSNIFLFHSESDMGYSIHWITTFITIFPKTCWTPHMIGLIATSILTNIEMVMSVNYPDDRRKKMRLIVNIVKILQILFNEEHFDLENIDSPENMVIIAKYRDNLEDIKVNGC